MPAAFRYRDRFGIGCFAGHERRSGLDEPKISFAVSEKVIVFPYAVRSRVPKEDGMGLRFQRRVPDLVVSEEPLSGGFRPVGRSGVL